MGQTLKRGLVRGNGSIAFVCLWDTLCMSCYRECKEHFMRTEVSSVVPKGRFSAVKGASWEGIEAGPRDAGEEKINFPKNQ